MIDIPKEVYYTQTHERNRGEDDDGLTQHQKDFRARAKSTS